MPQSPSRAPTVAALVAVALLAACRPAEQAPVEGQRIALDQVPKAARDPMASPDTSKAAWQVAANGQSISFGNAGEKPFLTLSCRLKDNPPTVRLIRHAEARPGQKALFPVIGNGTAARFKVDAALNEGEWRWEGGVPADDALLEVFTGTRDIEATLPGAGSLLIKGSRIPGDFIIWCKQNGRVQEPKASETSTTTPARPEPVEGR